jgi:hypothetical protein
MRLVSLLLGLAFVAVAPMSHARPYENGVFKGRIAHSADGNANDEDDWGAFPVAFAIIDAFGRMDKVVVIFLI